MELTHVVVLLLMLLSKRDIDATTSTTLGKLAVVHSGTNNAIASDSQFAPTKNHILCANSHFSICPQNILNPKLIKETISTIPEIHAPMSIFVKLSYFNLKDCLNSGLCELEKENILKNPTSSANSNKFNLQAVSNRELSIANSKIESLCAFPFQSKVCQEKEQNKLPQSDHKFQSLQRSIITNDRIVKQPKLNNIFSRMCLHGFHTWLCPTQKTNRGKTLHFPISSKVITSTTTEIPQNFKTGKEIFSDTFSTAKTAPTTMAVPKMTNQITQKSHKKKTYDKCSHAFHAWLCERSSNKNKVSTAAPLVTSTPPAKLGKALNGGPIAATVKPKSSINSGWDSTDPCTHAFHSWLCEYNNKRNDRSKQSLKKP